MPDESDPVSTPETLGVTPRFVLQHNAISRSIHQLSATARKLIAAAMSLLPPDLSSRTAAFSFADFCKALGAKSGGASFQLFKDAATECMECVITLETEKVVKGKRQWEKFTWVTYSSLNEGSGVCKITFSEQLTAFLREMKKLYAKIDLRDIGRLQSKYALKIFEMAKSYESLKGKDGNEEQTWYFERSVPELRRLLGVPENAYAEVKRFRQSAVELPIREINAAGVGIEIKTESVKHGRRLAGIRFGVRKSPRTAAKGRKKGGGLKLPEISAETRKEKELEHLKELYPEEFAAFYMAELEKPSFPPSESGFRKAAAEAAAEARLREKHGVVK